MTGAGLAHLTTLTGLERLTWGYVPVGDADLVPIRPLVNLRTLRFFAGHGITDAGMDSLRDLVQLKELIISQSQITGQGLAAVGQLRELEDLMLLGSRVETLEALRPLSNLGLLFLSRAPLDDAGLEPVRSLTALRYLSFQETRVTDAGLSSLVGLANLREVGTGGTAITEGGVAAFRQTRPQVAFDR